MVPTFAGRIEPRLFLLALIGIPWVPLISLVAPSPPAPFSELVETGYWVLIEVAIVGCVVFEPLYHFLMQFRWEKDWPISFFLLEGIPEGVLAYMLLRAIGPSFSPPATSTATFVTLFGTLWFLVWLTAIGPMRVLVPRWRFRGGRVV